LNLAPASPVFAAFGDGTPTIPNPNVFSDSILPKVDGASGAFTQSLPLDIPPGRNGLQPDVTLDYNSQRTQDSIVGYGWQLSIPYIQRLNKTGSQNLYSSNAYFSSSIDGELANFAPNATSVQPTIVTSSMVERDPGGPTTSDSFSYDSGSSGSNRLLMFTFVSPGAGEPTSATYNGQSLTIRTFSVNQYYVSWGYLVNPPTGAHTFVINYPNQTAPTYRVMVANNVNQTTPFDVDGNSSGGGVSSCSKSATTTIDNDLLLAFMDAGSPAYPATEGSGQTELWQTNPYSAYDFIGATKAAPTTGNYSMSFSFSATNCEILALSLEAGILNATTTQYVARIDSGSDNLYTFANNTWTVYDKKGTRYLYGSSDTGRQYDTGTGTSTNTYKWYLQEVRDTNGNYIKYTYNRDGNEIYPSQIIYTGNGASDGPALVTFATSTRSDTRISYAPGFRVATNYRVSEIDAAFNNQTVRKYLLSYGQGVNSMRSLLTSVQQQGYDDNNNLTSLPATIFTYASSSTQFYSPSAYGNPISSATYQVADTNGNGINDVNEFYYTGCSGTSTCTKGSKIVFDQSSTVYNYNDSHSPPVYWAFSPGDYPTEHGARYIDVNGDGKADPVIGWRDDYTPSNSTYALYLNTYSSSTGIGWVATSAIGYIPAFGYANTNVLTGGIFGDVNGDGLPDYSTNLPGINTATSYLGNGLGWDGTSNFVPPRTFPYAYGTPDDSQLVDVNGDGLDDWIYSDGSKTYVLLNTGTGWATTAEPQWTIGTSTLYYVPGSNPPVYRDRGIRFFDINGDGLPDYIRSYRVQDIWSCNDLSNGEIDHKQVVLLNTGNGWATTTVYTLPADIYSAYTVSSCAWVGPTWSEYANWNGNGQVLQDVITGVAYPKGGNASIIYAYSTSMNNPELPVSLLVAKEVGIYDGLGHAATTTYQYAGGKMYLASGVRDKKFAGFAIATTTAPDSITRAFYSQGIGTNNALGEQSDGYAQVNRPFRKDIVNLSGNLIQSNFYRWDSFPRGNGSNFVNVGRQVEQDYAQDGTHRDKATDYAYSTSTDDLLTQIDYGEVTGNSDGTFTDTGTDKRSTLYSYAASSSGNLSTLTEKKMVDAASSTVSDQKLYYDGLPFGQVQLGNNTRQEDWISGSTYASSTKTYNAYGLVATSTDRRGNATGYIYDSFNLYVATATNPLSQKTGFTYNYSNGKVKESNDPNGRLTFNSYDGIGRLTETDQSDLAAPSTLVTATTYQYTDNTTTPSTIHRADYLTSTTTVDTYDFYDGLNRLIQERKASQTAGTYAVTDKVYNPAGLLGSQSLPYFSSGSSYTTPTTTSLLFTSYAYDPLKRVLTTANAVGTTTNLYAKWTTTTTDANGNIKDYILDAFGNLANVIEHIGSTLATTTYAYDAANNLATTTDSLGNVRAFTYDGLARRLTAQDLHASTDTTFGTWNYTYDDANNLTRTVDPRNQTFTYAYDALNRVTSKNSNDQENTLITYTYDSCANGKGRLCIATTSADVTIASTYTYNPLGLIASEKKYVNGSLYTTSYSYDRQGNQTNIVYPDQSEVLYAFGPQNMVQNVKRREGAAYPWSTLVSSITYSPLGQENQIIWGSGATTTNTFDPNQLYRLTHKVTLLPDNGDWGTAAGNAMGFITSNFSPAASSSGSTPPNVSTNLNATNLWLSNSIFYNDSFEYGSNNWSFYAGSASSTNSIDCTVSFSGGCSNKTVVASTSWEWMPLVQQPVRIDPNVNYTLKFRAKATATTTIEANIQANHDSYNSYGLDSYVNVSPTWKEYSYYFSSTATTPDTNAILSFALGAAHTATYWLDDVELIPDAISKNLNPSFENISDPTGQNYNYGFWALGGDSEATESTDCTTATDGDCSANVNVLQATSTDWYVQFVQTQPIATGTTYILSFDAKSTVARDIDTLLQQNHGAYTNYTPAVHFTTSPAWSHYVIEFAPASGGDVNSVYEFNLGTAAGHAWFDNLHFFKKQATKITAPPPLFTGVYSASGGSTASAYQIQVVPRNGSWASPLWDSGKVTLSPQTQIGNRTATSTYAGPTLPSDGTDANKYFWRMKVWDNNNNPSPWTNGNDYFMTPGNRVQDLTYIYDPVGNITHLVDASFTKTAKTVDYTYDSLNRLVQASTTPDIASGAPNAGRNMIEKWSYDALGNILTDATTTLSGWATTTYTYAGNTGSLTANPDAATRIGNNTLTYDANGNETSGLGGLEESWEGRNLMSYNMLAGSTTAYAYDENNKRVRVGTDADILHYPNDYYTFDTGPQIPTRHVFLNGKDIVTITGATSSDTTAYNFTDSLNSTGVTANKNNRVQEISDYTPYGALNNHDQLAGYTEQRKYIGQPLDTATNLSYLNARYYNPVQGQFLSEDPVFVQMGSPAAVQSLVNQKMSDMLSSPQKLNAYSYSNDNPIIMKDPSGLDDGNGMWDYFWNTHNDSQPVANIKMQLSQEMAGAGQGVVSALTYTGLAAGSALAVIDAPPTAPYVFAGWSSVISNGYQNSQTPGVSPQSLLSPKNAILPYGIGVLGQSPIISGGSYWTSIPKVAVVTAFGDYFTSGQTTRATQLAGQAQNLATRAAGAAVSYASQSSPLAGLLGQLSVALAGLAAQLATYQAAPGH
jgi:RHS repeat-associated protein